MRTTIAIALACVAMCPAAAQEKAATSATAAVMNEDMGVPVFPYDITNRPYKVLGEVKAGVRKATVFSKSPSQKKIYGELWERAKRLGADAVVKATYGDAHVTAFSWGKASASGIAIRFLPAGATSAPADQ